jgi:hypothetical protein
MNPNAIPPLLPVGENRREEHRFKEHRRAIDLKVQGLVAARVNLPCVKEGILLATAVNSTGNMIANRVANSREQVKWRSEKKKPTPKNYRVPSALLHNSLQAA